LEIDFCNSGKRFAEANRVTAETDDNAKPEMPQK